MMTGRPCLQHSNITWYAIQKRRNESLEYIKEELEEAEVVDDDINPIPFNAESVDVYISNASIKKTLKKTLTKTPANDNITVTPEKKEKTNE
jgi:hypothetical protein